MFQLTQTDPSTFTITCNGVVVSLGNSEAQAKVNLINTICDLTLPLPPAPNPLGGL